MGLLRSLMGGYDTAKHKRTDGLGEMETIRAIWDFC